MEFSYHPHVLEYKFPFGVSSNTRTHTQSVFVKIEWDGFTGYGEACLPPYLGDTLEKTTELLDKAKRILKQQTYPCSIAEIILEIDELDDHANAAKAAIDIALHDLKGKIEKKSIQQLYRLNPVRSAKTACTIGIDIEEVIKQKIEDASAFEVLKIKAGTNDDKALIKLIRKYTNKPLYVDVNQGWKSKEEALELMHFFKENNVVLIEQPMPVDRIDEMAFLTQQNILPVIADESVKRLSDLQNLNGAFNGINIKLMKCTGIKEAFEMIELAKELNLKIFLGCMAESSCATSAMAQFIGCADYIDLDAPYLLKNDPFEGVSYKNGEVVLADLPGIGANPNRAIIDL